MTAQLTGSIAASPTSYPEVARPGTGWIREGHYWFAYGTRKPRVIRAIYYDAGDIPRRSSGQR